ncbi:hypothetical protein AGLY_013641 [Aphis glycines]|uniref:Uncharacterized protein n=1 Tax=Aphis glycines TaxID=307491 RepID=A0A6G0T7R6_APHGL|nr:hypothetical protein AGLY_013641 [Aphis glycines]
MKRTHSDVQKYSFQSQPDSFKQLKITSLFSRIPPESSKTIIEYNKNRPCMTPNSKSFSSPLSSPDVIPSSPVLKKNKATKSRKCLNRVLTEDIKLKDKRTISNTDTVSNFSKDNLGLTTKSIEKPDYDNDVDSQSYSFDTVSIESSNTEFSTDFFLDWLKLSINNKNDKCSVSRYLDKFWIPPIFLVTVLSYGLSSDCSAIIYSNKCSAPFDINLIEPHRCIIKKIEKDFGKICLTLTSCKSYEEDVCYLSGIW